MSDGEHREIRQYDSLEGRNPPARGQVMPPMDHGMPPGDHVMPPGGQVMPPGGQVTPGPEEGDGRGRQSVLMYQADGEGITSILRHLQMCYNKGQVCLKTRLHVHVLSLLMDISDLNQLGIYKHIIIRFVLV